MRRNFLNIPKSLKCFQKGESIARHSLRHLLFSLPPCFSSLSLSLSPFLPPPLLLLLLHRPLFSPHNSWSLPLSHLLPLLLHFQKRSERFLRHFLRITSAQQEGEENNKWVITITTENTTPSIPTYTWMWMWDQRVCGEYVRHSLQEHRRLPFELILSGLWGLFAISGQ